MNKPFSVIILAAGKGTRMKSDIPKVLHEIDGIPMISHIIKTSKNIGASKIVTVIGYKADMVKDALVSSGTYFALQEQQLGTGHAVLQCKALFNNFNGNILVLSGDVPLISDGTLKKLIFSHNASENSATVLSANLDNPNGYGRVVRCGNNLSKIVEHKDANDDELNINEINVGIYVFDSKKLFKFLPKIENNNIQSEYYLPDILSMMIDNKLKVGVEKTKNIAEIQGVNTVEQLHQINTFYNKP